VCNICGGKYVHQKTTAPLLAEADEVARGGVQVEIRASVAA